MTLSKKLKMQISLQRSKRNAEAFAKEFKKAEYAKKKAQNNASCKETC